ncbi:MAG: protein kinase, partial [Ruminococcus sp.]|nr:protein kinase [Ruminococcus sp.]
NVIKFWRLYPDYIKYAFTRSFTVGLHDPNKRIIENEWQKLFIRLRAEIIKCDCGRTNFTTMFGKNDDRTYKCPKCGTVFPTISFSNHDFRFPLYSGRKFFECEIDTDSNEFLNLAGEIVANKNNPSILGIRNCSEKAWKVKMPDGNFYNVPSGKGFKIWDGLEIDFGNVIAKID